MVKRGNGRIGLCCALALLAAPLGGCVETVVGAGAMTATAASEERGLKAAAVDLRIRAAINGLWLNSNLEVFRTASINVYEGRVLLTGVVPTPEARGEAVRLAWQAEGVREVINEIQVGKPTEIGDDTRDGWITAKLKSRLAFDEKVQAINYAIETVRGVIYLMGVAQNQAELDRVRNHARDIGYVRHVVSYVLLKDDPRRRAAK